MADHDIMLQLPDYWKGPNVFARARDYVHGFGQCGWIFCMRYESGPASTCIQGKAGPIKLPGGDAVSSETNICRPSGIDSMPIRPHSQTTV